MNGLLGGAMPQQMQQGGGLLGGGAMPQQNDSDKALKYAQALSKNPTNETANAIVAALEAEGDNSAQELKQLFESVGGNSEMLKTIADSIISQILKT